MSWIETLSKEAFQTAVREAMKPEIESLRADIKDLGKRVGDLEQRVSRLEGTIEGTMRAYEANLRMMFAEFQRNIEKDIFSRLIDGRGKSAA